MRAKFRWLYPFDFPIVVYAILGGLCAYVYGFRINWSVIFDFRLERIVITLGAPWLCAAAFAWQRFGLGRPAGEIIRRFASAVRSTAADWRSWYEAARIFAAVKICMTVYTHLKQEIPLLNPREYDLELSLIDRWLHFGVSPVDACLAFSSWARSVRVIDVLYILWYFVKAPVLLFFLFQPNHSRRWHFFTCYVLLWMVGGWFAIAFPSMGPVYVEPERFQHVPAPNAQKLQAMLWKHYEKFVADPRKYPVYIYEGIAAFPSLHVGIVVLYTIALSRYRCVFWPLLAYSAIVEIGSVSLGWHYAVDGYFAAALAIGLYYGTRPFFPDHPDGMSLSRCQAAGEPTGDNHRQDQC